MTQLVMREAPDDFGAFKIGQACLELGGTIVCVTVAPLTVFDHNQGYPRVDELSRRIRWIVFMTVDATFDVHILDEAIDAEAHAT